MLNCFFSPYISNLVISINTESQVQREREREREMNHPMLMEADMVMNINNKMEGRNRMVVVYCGGKKRKAEILGESIRRRTKIIANYNKQLLRNNRPQNHRT